jgi:predicted ATP-grasp superfamily ATP-dependent carboligase
MNIVFLSPHFPAHYFRFCQQLNNAGATVLGIGDAAYDDLSPEIRSAVVEYYRVGDMHDYDALLRACGYFTHQFGKLDRFESLNEYWLSTEARIRDDFNIYGVRSNDIKDVRQKSRMKEVFRQAGVPVARGRCVASVSEARALAGEIGFPMVVKPDAGVGALDTYRLENEIELETLFNSGPISDVIAEEFISGDLFSFDGLVDRDGQLLFYTAHTFSQGIMETVNEDRHVHYYSLREVPIELEEVGRNIVAAFGLKERFFHIEFFKTPDNRYVALEINMRPPGGFTTDMFNYANDIDIYRIWAELVVSGRSNFNYDRTYHCCYASRKLRHPYRHKHEEVIKRYADLILDVVQVPGVFSPALGDIGYIFRSPFEAEILEVVEFIQEFQTN